MEMTPSQMALAVKRFTTRSKRGRGASPNTVAKRRIVGGKVGEAASSKTFSDCNFVSAYTEIGDVSDFSSIKLSDAPYTLHLEAKGNASTPLPFAISSIMRVAAKLICNAFSSYSAQAGSPTIAAR